MFAIETFYDQREAAADWRDWPRLRPAPDAAGQVQPAPAPSPWGWFGALLAALDTAYVLRGVGCAFYPDRDGGVFVRLEGSADEWVCDLWALEGEALRPFTGCAGTPRQAYTAALRARRQITRYGSVAAAVDYGARQAG